MVRVTVRGVECIRRPRETNFNGASALCRRFAGPVLAPLRADAREAVDREPTFDLEPGFANDR